MDWLSNFIISIIDGFMAFMIFIIGAVIKSIVSLGESKHLILLFTNILVCILILFLVFAIILDLLCKIFGVKSGDIDMLNLKLKTILYWKSFPIRRFIRWNFLK